MILVLLHVWGKKCFTPYVLKMNEIKTRLSFPRISLQRENVMVILTRVEYIRFFFWLISYFLGLSSARQGASLGCEWTRRPADMERNRKYEGWNFNSGNYLFTTDTK